jgi:alkylation response protein AidB-like acyl-CoA dehydrogenase
MTPKSLKFDVPAHVAPVRDRVLRFVEDEVYPLERRLAKARRCGRVDRSEAAAEIVRLQALAKARGLWALGHPKEIGGQGMRFRDYIYVNEVQGRSELAQVCLGTHSLQDSLMLHRHASDALRAQYLSRIVAAEIYPSFAMTEPDTVSSDPTGIQTTAVLRGGAWTIRGRKWWTSNASGAAFTCVMARTEHDPKVPPHMRFSILLVPTDAPGYRIVRSTHVLGTEGASHDEVVYDNVRVPSANLVGERGHGFIIAQERLGPGRIFHCMRWIGQAQRAFDLMCARLVDRKVRDRSSGEARSLGRLQLMQQLVFDSYADIQCMRLLTLSAAEKMDADRSARVELAAAKAWGARALGRVVDRAVQAWGAKGLTEDTPLSAMYRHARAARFYDGPDEVHVSTVGRLMLRDSAGGGRWDFSRGCATDTSANAEAEMRPPKHAEEGEAGGGSRL